MCKKNVSVISQHSEKHDSNQINMNKNHDLKESKSSQELTKIMCLSGESPAHRTDHKERGEREHPGGVTRLF